MQNRRSCLKFVVVCCIYSMLSACRNRHSSPKKSVDPKIPVSLHGEIEDIFSISYSESWNRASVELDSWIAQRKYNTTNDFLPYMTSWYATVKGYWHGATRWLRSWFDNEERLTYVQQQYYDRVLGGANGDAELGFISDNVLRFFLSHLEDRLEIFYERKLSGWSKQQWERQLDSTLAVTDGKPMSLGQAMVAARTTNSVLSQRLSAHAYRSFGATPQAGLPPSLRGSGARAMATRSASKVLALATTRLLGAVITFGIIAYEIYDEHEEWERSKYFVEEEIFKSLDQLKEDLLSDTQAGVLAATREVATNAFHAMTHS